MNISIQETERADLIRYADKDDLIVAAIPHTLREGPFAEATMRFMTGIRDLIAKDGENANRLLPDSRAAEIGGLAVSTIGGAFADMIEAGISETRAIAQAEDRLMQPAAVDPLLASEIRGRVNSLPAPKQHGFIANATIEQTSALIGAGRQNTVLTPESWEALKERHMLLSHIAIAGLLARHQRLPSASSPLGSGPDEHAALAASSAALAVHKKRAEAVKDLETTLKGIVNVVSRASRNTNKDEVFNMLKGKAR